MITSIAPAGRAVLTFLDDNPLLPSPVGMFVRTTVSEVPEPVRLTLTSAAGPAHLTDIADYADALATERLTAFHTRGGVDLVVTATLPCGTPIRVAATAMLGAADYLATELGLTEDKALELPVAVLRRLADPAAMGVVPTIYRDAVDAGPITFGELAELGEPGEEADDTVTVTIPAEVVTEATAASSPAPVLEDTQVWEMPPDIAAALNDTRFLDALADPVEVGEHAVDCDGQCTEPGQVECWATEVAR